MTLDMTQGKPVNLMLRFAIPLMLSSLLQQLYTLCDSMIVGRLLGTVAFAATGAASYLNCFPLYMLQGAINGFGVTLSQRFGAKDSEGFRNFFGCAITLSLSLALFLTLSGTRFVLPLLQLLNTPEQLVPDAVSYLKVLWMGFCITAMVNMFNTSLLAMGDSRTPLMGLVISSFVNIILDWVFLAWLHMGVAGAALATILAQLLAASWSLRNLLRIRTCLPKRSDFRPRMPVVRELLRLGLPPLLSSGVIASGELFVQAAINACGVAFVTGMTAARRYFNLLNVVGGGLEASVATFVGQNWGAGRKDRIRQGTRNGVTMGLMASVTIGTLVFLLAEHMILLFVPDATGEIISAGASALRVQSLFLVTLYWLCEYRAAIQGMGNAIIPMISGFLELALRIASTLLLPLFLGREGLYFTDAAAWVPTTVMLMVCYYSMRRKYLLPETQSAVQPPSLTD